MSERRCFARRGVGVVQEFWRRVIEDERSPGRYTAWLDLGISTRGIILEVVFAAARRPRTSQSARGCARLQWSRFRLFLPRHAASASAQGRHSLSFVSELTHTSSTLTPFIIPNSRTKSPRSPLLFKLTHLLCLIDPSSLPQGFQA